jgi:hypothetical protein
MDNDTDFFINLLRKGEILKCESNDLGWISRIQIDDKEYVLTINRCHDISDMWEYKIVDRFDNRITEGQYTKINLL